MASWPVPDERPRVSILCNTYNQAAYLDDALRGFLLQETRFPFEIILHDDASTDTTPAIAERYARQYPHIIRYIRQPQNCYSQGIKPTFLSFPYARGEFIAFCEGDDFWMEAAKLQAQVELLDQRPDADLCFHPAFRLLANDQCSGVMSAYGQAVMRFSASKALAAGGGWCPTASVLARRCVFEQFTAHFQATPVGDVFFQALGAARGGAVFWPVIAAVYRADAHGSWSRSLASAQAIGRYHDGMQHGLGILAGLVEPGFAAALSQSRARCSLLAAKASLRLGLQADFRAYIETSWQWAAYATPGQALLYGLRRWPALAARLLAVLD